VQNDHDDEIELEPRNDVRYKLTLGCALPSADYDLLRVMVASLGCQTALHMAADQLIP
jgi:hypothetical protein